MSKKKTSTEEETPNIEIGSLADAVNESDTESESGPEASTEIDTEVAEAVESDSISDSEEAVSVEAKESAAESESTFQNEEDKSSGSDAEEGTGSEDKSEKSDDNVVSEVAEEDEPLPQGYDSTIFGKRFTAINFNKDNYKGNFEQVLVDGKVPLPGYKWSQENQDGVHLLSDFTDSTLDLLPFNNEMVLIPVSNYSFNEIAVFVCIKSEPLYGKYEKAQYHMIRTGRYANLDNNRVYDYEGMNNHISMLEAKARAKQERFDRLWHRGKYADS